MQKKGEKKAMILQRVLMFLNSQFLSNGNKKKVLFNTKIIRFTQKNYDKKRLTFSLFSKI